MTQGKIYGLGLGPGAPDLMTVRADRVLRQAKHVAFFRKKGRPGQARQIVEGLLPEQAVEHPMEYPVTTEVPFHAKEYNQSLAGFYEDSCAHLLNLVGQGADVVVLCEGDPFFYGSFMHLHARLHEKCTIEVVPAITGMSAAWTATNIPMTWGDDVLSVLMGTLPEEDLEQHAARCDALVFMKLGRNLPKVQKVLRKTGRIQDAWIIEYASMMGQSVCRLADYANPVAPYFSIIVVHGNGRRP